MDTLSVVRCQLHELSTNDSVRMGSAYILGSAYIPRMNAICNGKTPEAR